MEKVQVLHQILEECWINFFKEKIVWHIYRAEKIILIPKSSSKYTGKISGLQIPITATMEVI